MRILLSEDDTAVRAFVGRALQIDGHVVDIACDGLQALDVLMQRDGAFDLVVSDVKMPFMDGIALTRSASSRWPDLPIVLMTGYADQRERIDEVRTLVRGVLPKPFSLEDIRAAVRHATKPGGAERLGQEREGRAA